MPKVLFIEPFDYRPTKNNRMPTIAYKPGEYTVNKECADIAIARGKAKLVRARKEKKAQTPEKATGDGADT